MLACIQDGLHGVRRYVFEGVPLLGVGNVTENGIDLTDANRITEAEHVRLAPSQVRRGDLLITITGRVGTAAIYDSDAPANLSAHVALGRPKATQSLLYLKHYLASRFGAASLTQALVGSTHPHINVRRLAELPIPLPPPEIQRQIAGAMEAAREVRNKKLLRADRRLATLDRLTLKALKIPEPPTEGRTCFGIYLGMGPKIEELRRLLGTLCDHRITRHRLDPQHYQPNYRRWLSAMMTTGGASLGALISLSNEQWTPFETDSDTVIRYIEINGIDTKTGEIVRSDQILAANAPSRARMVVRTGDILVSLTRPHLGAVAEVTPEYDGCVASTGFAVLRGLKRRKDFFATPGYLWSVLRSAICREQMMRNSTGGNYPAISESGLLGLFIPTRLKELQRELVAEISSHREEARRLRSEAEASWTAAKQRFEAALLGSSR